MNDITPIHGAAHHRVGRPRRGTEASRADTLVAAATRVFLRDGYACASIDKVAAEAGVSTRTIYERYKNKADLIGAVISRLVDRDMAAAFAPTELDRLDPREALTGIGRTLAARACDPDSAALFRILAGEAHRFPELAAKMRCNAKDRICAAIADYFRAQVQRGLLQLRDPENAAVLLLQMICAELHECHLFGTSADIAALDLEGHVDHVVDIFLNGAMPRGVPGDASS